MRCGVIYARISKLSWPIPKVEGSITFYVLIWHIWVFKCCMEFGLTVLDWYLMVRVIFYFMYLVEIINWLSFIIFSNSYVFRLCCFGYGSLCFNYGDVATRWNIYIWVSICNSYTFILKSIWQYLLFHNTDTVVWRHYPASLTVSSWFWYQCLLYSKHSKDF